jgi:hypothetical protein
MPKVGWEISLLRACRACQNDFAILPTEFATVGKLIYHLST